LFIGLGSGACWAGNAAAMPELPSLWEKTIICPITFWEILSVHWFV